MKKEYDIFISYRREGGKEYARNLTSELVSRGFHPFLDFDELVDGKFDKRITDAIESAPVFMFILSPGSLDRCVNEDDWVRKEILHAVKHNRHIVPVDIDKQFVAFPKSEDFPQIIKEALGQHQFSQIQTETLYKVSIDEMVRNRIQPAIEEYQRERQKAAGMAGAEIHIETDMDCHVQRFHRDMIIAKVDEENVIHLPKGKHKLQFIAISNPDIKDSCDYKVEDVTESDFIEVFLQEKAGVVSVEAEKLEKLRKEKQQLEETVQDLKQRLEKTEEFAQYATAKSKEEKESLLYEIEELSEHLKEAEIALKEQKAYMAEAKHMAETKEKHMAEVEKMRRIIEMAEREAEEARKQAEAESKRDKAEIEKMLKRIEESKREAEEARKQAEAESKRDKAKIEKMHETIKVGDVEFMMIHVEGGTFTMGEGSEAHQVTLPSYYIGETLVTQALWQAVMGSNPSHFKGDQHPVEKVCWNDCQNFIKKLNQKTGKKFRMLTEAEWEYAVRGGNKPKGYKYAGSNNLNEVAWYENNSEKKTHPVKQMKANELGIFDMCGNVWEWCQDWYGNYDRGPQTNPTGPTSGSSRVLRGGSWHDVAMYCRSSYRYGSSPSIAYTYLGFRLALS